MIPLGQLAYTTEVENYPGFPGGIDGPDLMMKFQEHCQEFGLEVLTSSKYMTFIERASLSAFAVDRRIGVGLAGDSGGWHWAASVFGQEESDDDGENDEGYGVAGRLTWAPLRTEDDSHLLHMGLGYRYSNAKEGFRFSTEPEFNQAPLYVDTGFGTKTGVLPANDFQTITAELSWRRGPLWLASEYTRTDVNSPALGNPVFDGYWLSAAWTRSSTG